MIANYPARATAQTGGIGSTRPSHTPAACLYPNAQFECSFTCAAQQLPTFGNINVINRINGYAYQDTPFLL